MNLQQLKGLKLIILVFIILNNGCKSKSEKTEFNYGWEERLISSRIKMDCSHDNLAIYSEYDAFRFQNTEYEIKTKNLAIGKAEFYFVIELKNHLEKVKGIERASISFCLNGKLYHGRGMLPKSSSIPPSCHFFYSYDEYGRLKFNKKFEIICMSHEFLTPEQIMGKKGINK
jgi:hypothetical protein